MTRPAEAYRDAFIEHDWTGVYVHVPDDGEPYLALTALHHGDDTYYEVAAVRHEVSPARLIESLPAVEALPTAGSRDAAREDTEGGAVQWALDLYDADHDLVTSRRIAEPEARALFDGDLDERLRTGRRNLSAWSTRVRELERQHPDPGTIPGPDAGPDAGAGSG